MNIGVVIGSNREGRSTDRAAKWVASEASKIDDANVELLDLRDYDLPFFSEPISPQYNPNRKPKGEVKRWLDALARQDALVIVSPEYNRSIPAVLKNAIDYVAYELDRKPVAIVAHGSSNGAQAVSHLRGIIPGVLGVTVPRAVYLPIAGYSFTEDGALDPELAAKPHGPEVALTAMLTDLVAYGSALAAIRKQ